MPKPRIAVIGDTAWRHGELTGVGAVAVELARGWDVEVGFRSVAASGASWEFLDAEFGRVGVTTWLTIRRPDEARVNADIASDIRMGDPLEIGDLFAHDIVILGTSDLRLRRFLADLPVHTRPDVRILTSIHIDHATLATERLDDALRFDVIIGSEADFAILANTDPDRPRSGLEAIHDRMPGSNLRAAVSWGRHGEFAVAEPDAEISITPAEHAPTTTSALPWAAFFSAVAVNVARRTPWDATGREATSQFAKRAHDLRRERV